MKCSSVLPEAEAVVYGDASTAACGNAAVHTCTWVYAYTLTHMDMPTFSSFFFLFDAQTHATRDHSFDKGKTYLSEKTSATQV